MTVNLPYPPFELANRVGAIDIAANPWEYYDELGRLAKADLLAALPEGWSFAGKRTLDFGCGAGRTLRHFAGEAAAAEMHGCDIDRPSVDWINEHLNPPIQAFASDVLPPLDKPDAHYDLVWVVSVFTHLTDSWSRWLLELHRVLRPGGLLLATFMGQGISEAIAGESWEEDRVGMLVLKPGQSWDLGGPMVLHSPWWLRAHWGRAFEIVDVVPEGFCANSGVSHGLVVARKDERPAPTVEELERPEPGEPREAIALQHNVAHLAREGESLRHDGDWLRSELEAERGRRELAERERELAERRREIVEGSSSWRVTSPLRRAAATLRDARR